MGPARSVAVAAAVFVVGLGTAFVATGTPVPLGFTTTEGTARTGAVARFDDFACTTKCKASITWGDGSTSDVGTVNPNSGTVQTVTGGHTFSGKGHYDVTGGLTRTLETVMTNTTPGQTETATTPATVVDQP